MGENAKNGVNTGYDLPDLLALADWFPENRRNGSNWLTLSRNGSQARRNSLGTGR